MTGTSRIPKAWQAVLARGGHDARRAARAVTRVRPRRSVGAVEAPHEAEATEITVLGFAHVPGDRVTAVVVFVQGRPLGLARLGLRTPDVEAARRSSEALWSGWAGEVDLSPFAEQEVVISAVAVTATGLVERLDPRPVTVHGAPGDERCSLVPLDSPAPDVLFVSGVTATRVPPSRVEVVVDGRPAGRARLLTGPSEDFEDLPGVHTPMAGLTHVVERADAQPGAETRVEAIMTMTDGTTRRIGPVTARIPELTVRGVDDASLAERVRRRAGVADPPPTAGVRILAVTHSLELGGGQLYLSELLDGLLAATDVSVVVVAPRDGPLRETLEGSGATVHLSGEYPAESQTAYESMLEDLGSLASYHASNVVLVNTMSSAIGADLARLLDLPYVWAVHESFAPPVFWAEAFGPRGYDVGIRDRGLAAIRQASTLVFEADATRELFESYAAADRLVTLPYGIGLPAIDEFRASRSGPGPRAGDRFVELLVIGTFEPRKAHARLAIAFSRVADEFPESRLVMVGATGDPYTRVIRDVVRRLHLGDRIRIVPVTSDLYEWYERADALVSASDVESLPRSMLEAMAFDVPVVAAATYGLSEVITDGSDGILVEPRDLLALESGLRRFLALDPARRAEMGRRAGQAARSWFGSADYLDAWSALLRGLVDDPHALPRRPTR